MRKFLHQRHGGQIKSVAHGRLERADAALAQHDVWVSTREQIFGREQPFLNRGGGAAFEQHGLFDGGKFSQQRVILHIPRAHLEQVRELRDDIHVILIQHFRHDRQSRFLAGFGQPLERLAP